jgi:hypothetical protein
LEFGDKITEQRDRASSKYKRPEINKTFLSENLRENY